MSVDLATLAIRVETLEAKAAERDLDRLAAASGRAEKSAGGLKNAMASLAGALAGLGIARLAREAIAMADAWSSMQGRINLVSTSTANANRAMSDLYGIAQRTHVGLEATVDLYTRMARATQDLGVSQRELKGITETINQALSVSGTSAAEAAGGLMQLSQGFAAGALRGDELNSVIESMPRVAQALADGMGVSIGQLRKLGAEGKITADVMRKAFVDQADEIAAEFSKMPTTVEQAMVSLRNSILKTIGTFDQAAGITAKLAAAITGVADNMGAILRVAGVVASVVGVALLGAMSRYLVVTIATTASNLALGLALSGMTVRAAAAAAAMRGLSVAMSFFGGPIGLAITGVALAIGAVTTASSQAKAQTENLTSATQQFGAAMKQANEFLGSAAAGSGEFGSKSNSAVSGTKALKGATNDLALATWGLANARAEAARQALAEAYASNQKKLNESRNPGILGSVGRWVTEDVRTAEGRAARSRRREYERSLVDQSGQLLGAMVKLAFDPAANKADDYAQALGGVADKTGKVARATEEAAAAMKKLRDETADVLDGLMTPLERETKRIRDQQITLRTALDKGVIDLREYRDAIDRMFPERLSEKSLIKVPDVGELKKPWEEAGEALRQGIEDHKNAWNDALSGMGQSFRNFVEGWVVDGKANWRSLLSDMLNLLEGWARSAGGKFSGVFQKIGGALGASAGRVSTGVGAAIGQGLGLGTGNGTADMAISVAGGALGGMFASTTMATSFASAIGTALTPALGTAMATSLTGFLGSAAFLGPIAIIAALGAATLLGNKQPSNFGALATLSDASFTLSGSKRNEQTSGMATAAADAVLQGQQMLRDAGIQLGVTVRSLDLGTRDMTDIILSNGKALTSATGDAAAAAETALRAVLEGATYTSAAQENLVRSMLAAGAGFDQVAGSIGVFNAKMAAAQGLQQSISDAILKLSNPQAYDTTILQRSQDARLKELQDFLSGGFLSQVQFDGLAAQLQQLNQLETAEVTKRYEQEAQRAAEAAARAAAATSSFANAVGDATKSLQDFYRSLVGGPLAQLSPEDAYTQARRDFEANKTNAAMLPQVGQAFLQAAQSYLGSSLGYFKDREDVLLAVEKAGGLPAGFSPTQPGSWLGAGIKADVSGLQAPIQGMTNDIVAQLRAQIAQINAVREEERAEAAELRSQIATLARAVREMDLK